jgi:hypothetical protein
MTGPIGTEIYALNSTAANTEVRDLSGQVLCDLGSLAVKPPYTSPRNRPGRDWGGRYGGGTGLPGSPQSLERSDWLCRDPQIRRRTLLPAYHR